MRFGRNVTKWILGGLMVLWAGRAQGAPVWVSTTVPSSDFTVGGMDITTDPSGEVWTTFNQYALSVSKIFCAKTSGATWSVDPVYISATNRSDLGSDRQIVVDSIGTPHVASTDSNFLFHSSRPFAAWEFERVTSYGLPIVEYSLVKDKSDTLQMVHMESLYPYLPYVDLYYAKASTSGWSSETVRRSTITQIISMSAHVSLDTKADGTPVLAFASMNDEPVRILTKSGGTWTTIQSFSSNWRWPTLRIDDTDRIHLVMSSSSPTTTIRYVLMNSSGAVQDQHDYPLPEIILFSNPPRTSLAVDESRQPHIASGNVYINPAREVTHLSANYSDSKLTLAQGSHPYLLGKTLTDTSVKVTALLDAPGTVHLVAQSTHSLTWSFAPASAPVLGHRLVKTSDGVDVSGLLGPTATAFTQTGMAPNESQQLTTRAVFPGMSLDSAPGATAHTMCVSPLNLQLSRPSGNTVSLSWTPAGNVAGTLYRLRLIPSQGSGVVLETTNQSALFPLVDPTLPYALTIAAVNGDGLETFVSTLTHSSRDGAGTQFSFGMPDGLGVDVALQGTSVGPELAVAVAPADSFPTAPTSFGNDTPTGVGFSIPTIQAVPSGQWARVTLRYPEGRLNAAETLTLARYDPDKNLWIPLATQSDTPNRRLTASTRALGLFQVMVRASQPTDVGNARVYPNPFRPSIHGIMAIQEVPAGTQVRIFSDGGRLVREFTTSAENATWDGRDGDGNIVHSGAYILRLEQNGETKRVRFVLERP